MQLHELKGIFPTSFKVSDLGDDEVMTFVLKPDEDAGPYCDTSYHIEAKFESAQYGTSVELLVPTASEHMVSLIVSDKDGDKTVCFTREFFLNFIKGIVNLQTVQNGE